MCNLMDESILVSFYKQIMRWFGSVNNSIYRRNNDFMFMMAITHFCLYFTQGWVTIAKGRLHCLLPLGVSLLRTGNIRCNQYNSTSKCTHASMIDNLLLAGIDLMSWGLVFLRFVRNSAAGEPVEVCTIVTWCMYQLCRHSHCLWN